jgi:hypothetical protein
MKERPQSTGTSPLHQSVTEKLKFKVGTKSIAVDFTDQRISAHAGTAFFWGWLHPSGFLSVLEKALPHQMPLSNNHLTPLEKAVGFLQGILCEARKLTHVAYLQRDPLMEETSVPHIHTFCKAGKKRVLHNHTFLSFPAAYPFCGLLIAFQILLGAILRFSPPDRCEPE